MQGSKLVYMPNQLLDASFELPNFSLIFFENETKCKTTKSYEEKNRKENGAKGSKEGSEQWLQKEKRRGCEKAKQ